MINNLKEIGRSFGTYGARVKFFCTHFIFLLLLHLGNQDHWNNGTKVVFEVSIFRVSQIHDTSENTTTGTTHIHFSVYIHSQTNY